jgi:hypothetical protein
MPTIFLWRFIKPIIDSKAAARRKVRRFRAKRIISGVQDELMPL